jgi:transposase
MDDGKLHTVWSTYSQEDDQRCLRKNTLLRLLMMNVRNLHTCYTVGHMQLAKSRARILLKAADGWEDQAIATALSVGCATVERLRQRFVEEGLGALADHPRPGMLPKLDAKAEARLIAEACSAAPDGRQRWTLQLLADRVVALGLTEAYSYESVRRVLKKRTSSHGSRSSGASRK